jgi:excisionase family DNA binding protein
MTHPEAVPQLLRPGEAAAFLNVKESTIRAWLTKRKLPRVHVGRRMVRIPREALERLIEENTIPTRHDEARADRHAR